MAQEQSSSQTTKFDSLKLAVTIIQEETEKQETKIQRLKEKLEVTESQKITLDKQVSDLHQEIEAMKQEQRASESQSESKNKIISSLEAELNKVKKEFEVIDKRNDLLVSKVAQQQGKYKSLLNEFKKLKDLYKQCKADNERLRNERNKLHSEKKVLTAQKVFLERKVARLTGERQVGRKDTTITREEPHSKRRKQTEGGDAISPESLASLNSLIRRSGGPCHTSQTSQRQQTDDQFPIPDRMQISHT